MGNIAIRNERDFSTGGWFLVAIACLAALSTGARQVGDFPGYVILKALPIWMLAWRARPRPGVNRDWLLFAGLVFGSGGDIALSLTFPNSFIVGLSLFLCGHIFYILYFAGDFAFAPGRLVAALVGILPGATVAVWIAPSLGAMQIPVFAYIGVILIMNCFAAFRATPAWPLVFGGAVVFLVSDSLIAINKFVQEVPLSSLLILGTYYPAQILITEGCLRGRERGTGR